MRKEGEKTSENSKRHRIPFSKRSIYTFLHIHFFKRKTEFCL